MGQTKQNQRRHVRLAAALLLMLLCAGCATVLPPEHPTISIYPTVYPVRILKGLVPANVPPNTLQTLVSQAGWLDGFGGSRLADSDWRLVARGIARKGYAEIDGRRAGGRIRWITFAVPKESRELRLTAGYARRPPSLHCVGVLVAGKPDQILRRKDAYHRMRETERWTSSKGAATAHVDRVTNATTGKLDHWRVQWISRL
ncbi:MAG: hypothetical protein KAI66_02230 [Lentisphaeria bacterium]|nr:hypothetical protein [Lentisphaeria bacterium]